MRIVHPDIETSAPISGQEEYESTWHPQGWRLMTPEFERVVDLIERPVSRPDQLTEEERRAIRPTLDDPSILEPGAVVVFEDAPAPAPPPDESPIVDDGLGTGGDGTVDSQPPPEQSGPFATDPTDPTAAPEPAAPVEE